MTRQMIQPKMLLLSALLPLSPVAAQAPATLPEPVSAVLSGDAGAALLKQCSRAVPKAERQVWQPRPADIVRMETALPAALHRSGALRGDPMVMGLAGWRRQYVGIVRKGRHFLYGNFFPAQAGGTDEWRLQPVMVCDGSPRFFGAEMDVKSGRITHLAFNGKL